MNLFPERLAKAMAFRNVTGLELAENVGASSPAVSAWRNGVHAASMKHIKRIADYLDINVEYLLGEDVPMVKDPVAFIPPTVLPDSDIVTFAVLGDVAAGYDSFPLEAWEGATVAIPKEYLKGRDPKEFFVLRVVGDSMFPAYIDGDIILVLKQSTLNRSGDIGVVLYDSDYASLKKVEYVMGEDWMKLIPLNPNYPPITIQDADLDKCRILGIPKLLIREIEQ